MGERGGGGGTIFDSGNMGDFVFLPIQSPFLCFSLFPFVLLIP